MDTDILLILLQDGVVNGAVYALLALCLVLVFAVTRVIFIPQGEFVAFGALTYAALDAGRLPGSVWLLAGLGVAAFLTGLLEARRLRSLAALLRLGATTLLVPAVIIGVGMLMAPLRPGVWVEAALTVLIVAPMAPYIHRLAFAPLREASVLVLLIAAVGVHMAMTGLGLLVFGPEGYRATGFSESSFTLGPLAVPGQAVWVLGVTAMLMGGLALLFGRTLAGKALRATAVNPLGARLVGIPAGRSGRVAFLLAGAIGALSGVLVVPMTTITYDSGFLIGLKGFVAAIIGGLVSYPVAVLAALVVGCVESLASFEASAFKEVLVFSIIIPVLLWRSLRAPATEDAE